ncbi:MAG: carboxypeptidase-like regulatory domain-containing protein [Acidobacteriota bacterium]
MTKKKFLDSIDVKSPCSESWDEMFGNDEVRFCSHCAKNVHNLSAMTQKKAEDLIKNSNGKLCVRYVKTPNGNLITSPPKLTKITRRATIAASVLATSLTLSTFAYSQGEPIKPKDNSSQAQKDKSVKNELKQEVATISGTVKDAAEAVIAGARVTLFNLKTKEIRHIKSNDSGVYEFNEVEPSVYKMEIESPGFKKSVYQDINISKDLNLKQDIVLELGAIMGDIIIVEEPVKTNEEKITQNVDKKPIIALPITHRNTTELLKLQPLSPPKKKKKKN